MTEKIDAKADKIAALAQQELNVLYEISCAMRTTLELNHILYIILTGVTSHSGLGYNRAILFLVNPQARCLECKMAIGPESGEHAKHIWQYIEESRQELNDLIHADKITEAISQSSLYKSLRELTFSLDPTDPNVLTQAYHKAVPWHILPNDMAKYTDDPFLQVFKTHELLIMPLKTKDIINGLIIADNIYTKKPISDNDIRFFTMLANQAGLAIENSRLYEMVVHRSRTDSLTGLWNHGFFQDKLTEELQKAEQKQYPLSLVFIDLDNFKKLNDTFGHQEGDLILKKLADIFKESSRGKDYVCRYGGEEFGLILIGSDQKQSFDIAERLRERIRNYSFPLGNSPQNVSITVSIGIATFPNDANNKEELIGLADKSMYIAKFTGKDKTCVAS